MERSDTEKLFFTRLLGLQKCLIMQNTCIDFLFIPYFSTINMRLIANIFYQKHIIHKQNTNKKYKTLCTICIITSQFWASYILHQVKS